MNRRSFPLIATLSALAAASSLLAADASLPDLALQPAHIVVAPWKQHIPPTKRQGVAGIERTAKGRLWSVYGRDVESTRNFQVLKCSDDDGKTWSEVKLMILPHSGTRAMSANVWIDPLGRLWVFWGQSVDMQDGRFGVWAIVTDEPDKNEPKWSAPHRIGDGIMLNKPTVLANGDWLLTSSVWKADNSIKVYASTDKGKTWQGGLMLDERDGVTYPDGVQAKDGTIYIVYDYHRTPEGVIHMATFGEEDVRAGKPVSDKVRLRELISRLPETKP